MNNKSFLSNIDIESLDHFYEKYKNDKDSVDKSWQIFFEGFDLALNKYETQSESSTYVEAEFKVVDLINAYRLRGHLFTNTNPVRARRAYKPDLSLKTFGLSASDLSTKFRAGDLIGIGTQTLSTIIDHLELTYCHSIGAEYLYIRMPKKVEWLRKNMEDTKNQPVFTPEQKKDIYYHLMLAGRFEQFIHKKFTGQKRFSLEGAEAIIPALDAIIEKGSSLGVESVVIGMPHRGRLNVLANILQKPYKDIFREFTGDYYDADIDLGDVKYHLGYSNTTTTDSGKKVELHLLPNPSHLEAVLPVTQGVARALADTKYNDYKKVIPVAIHGDAAIAAQGVVYETVQMSKLKGYTTGGTIHIVINNQVGFTTNYIDARSSTYCTDVAKVVRAPVFHVNGDDVEALIFTINLALEYRQKFHSDVFIDLLCYRKYGHNEGDEPRFTQPYLYDLISKHPNPCKIYSDALTTQEILSDNNFSKLHSKFDTILEEAYKESLEEKIVSIKPFMAEMWDKFFTKTDKDFITKVDTSYDKQKLIDIFKSTAIFPEGKKPLSKLKKIIKNREKLIDQGSVDWAIAELLAYGSLLNEGVDVRLSGQDSERGTFSHRHSVYKFEGSNDTYTPLKHISDNQGTFSVYNSLLSEYGVLGFEFGYSIVHPAGLNIWEAQFGDFYNVAQVIIDQYISSAEEKWGLNNGLVLLLPHGYEGQGPEHSSARPERFLNIAKGSNLQIANCSTPANFFHIMRRQVVRDFRTPLVIFTPKSLLRNSSCISTLDELSNGEFKEVIDDDNVSDNVSRVVFCTGKIYYELLERKIKLDSKDIALVRIEQLHPFPTQQIKDIVSKYKSSKLNLWVQEEPLNMGAWEYINDAMKDIVDLEPVARFAKATPATGLSGLHKIGQQEIINKVFRRCDCDNKYKYCGLQCAEGSSQKEVLKIHRFFNKNLKHTV